MQGARLGGHPIHPVTVAFPLALLGANLVLDAIDFVLRAPRFAEAATFALAAGAVAGLPAAAWGALDWLAIARDSRARRIATRHGLINLGLVATMALAWLGRREQAKELPGAVPIALGLAAA